LNKVTFIYQSKGKCFAHNEVKLPSDRTRNSPNFRASSENAVYVMHGSLMDFVIIRNAITLGTVVKGLSSNITNDFFNILKGYNVHHRYPKYGWGSLLCL